MEEKRHQYKSGNITVSYNPKICIHAAECVKGLPEVFDSTKKPWVNPGGTSADRIAEVIQRCPSGALLYERHDGAENEKAPDQATIKAVKNGPLYVTGKIQIHNTAGELILSTTRAALCRCGKSNNKPFCDNTHIKVKFNE